MTNDANDWRVMLAWTRTDDVFRRRWSYLFTLGILETIGLGGVFLAFFGWTWVLEHPLRLGGVMVGCTLALHASAYAVRSSCWASR